MNKRVYLQSRKIELWTYLILLVGAGLALFFLSGCDDYDPRPEARQISDHCNTKDGIDMECAENIRAGGWKAKAEKYCRFEDGEMDIACSQDLEMGRR